MANKEEIGTALMVAGVFIAFVAVAFPQQVASGLATVVVDTSPPDVNATNPSGSQSSPTHFNPDTTVTLKMYSLGEKVSNPRCEIGSGGSFSDSCESGWSYSEDDPNSNLSGNQNDSSWYTEGSGSLKLTAHKDIGRGHAQFTKTVDLTGVDKLSFDAAFRGDEAQVFLEFYVGGTEKWSGDAYRDEPPQEFNPQIDVSSYSRSTQLKVRVSGNGSRDTTKFYVDDITSSGGAGETVTLSYDHSDGSEYWYTGSWSTSGHTGEKLPFTFKAEDDSGNIGSDTAYALIGSYADGYFTLNGQKLSKGNKITISTRSVDLKFTKTTSVAPDEVWYTVRDSDGNWLQKKSDTVKTSSPWTWSYTFPSDGTYEVNGYCKSYGKSVQVMSFRTGVNTSPVPQLPFPSEAMIVLGTGIAIAAVGGVLRFRPETF